MTVRNSVILILRNGEKCLYRVVHKLDNGGCNFNNLVLQNSATKLSVQKVYSKAAKK